MAIDPVARGIAGAALTGATNSAAAAASSATAAASSATSASSAATTASNASSAAQLTKGVFATTAAAMGLGVAGAGPITGGSGGTNGTFSLAFTGGTGSGAAGKFVVSGGALTAIVITAPGSYTVAPTFSFASSTGLTGASATCILGTNVDVGEYFSVPSSSNAQATILYRVDAGPVATQVSTFPSTTVVDPYTAAKSGAPFNDINQTNTPITAVNTQDAAALTWTATYNATSLGINLTTNRRANFSTKYKTGGAQSRWALSALINSLGAAKGVGIAFYDATEAVWWQALYTANGWLVFRTSSGGGTTASSTLPTFQAGDTVKVTADHFDDGATYISVQVNSGPIYKFGATGVPVGGSVRYAFDGACNADLTLSIDGLPDIAEKRISASASSTLSQADRNLIGAFEMMLQQAAISRPSGFVASRLTDIGISRNGSKALANYYFASRLADDDRRVNVLWVDYAVGLDTNPGTQSAPLKTLQKAISLAGAGMAAKIYVQGPALLPRSACWNATPLSANVEVLAIGGNVISSMHDDTLSWTLNSGNTWQATYTNTLYGVTDFASALLTPDGDAFNLALAASLAACQSTPGSYYASGGVVYVTRSDASQPNADLRVYTSSTGVNGKYEVNGGSLFIGPADPASGFGFEFHGGNNAFFVRMGTVSQQIGLTARNCAFKHGATNSNGLHTEANARVLLKNCVAAKNRADGFNYHSFVAAGDYQPPQVLEIDCIGRYNGEGASGTNNGSSIHGGAIIRLNGNYHHNQNRQVHDISGDNNNTTVSWNIACSVHDPIGSNSAYCAGLAAAPFQTTMWLDGCSSQGATALEALNSGANQIYTSNFNANGGTNVANSNVGTYTP